MFNVAVGIIWQTALVAIAIYFILMQWIPVLVCLALVVITCTILKKSWWDRLPED
jgi:hypothetical protein